MVIQGQETVIQAASDLLATYEKGDGRAYLDRLQTLMDTLLPFFPHLATAVATHPLIKGILNEWQENGDVPQEAIMELWEEYFDAYVGRA
jgi:hypothetical protein